MSKQKQQTIRLERGAEDAILPQDFFTVINTCFLPVMALTYVLSVVGIALNQGDFLYYISRDTLAYFMALFIVLWVAVPSIIWVLLNDNPLYAACCRAVVSNFIGPHGYDCCHWIFLIS